MASEKNTRETNIEALRIIAMIFIVFYHLRYLIIEDNCLAGCVFGIWGIDGVDIFVCIFAWYSDDGYAEGGGYAV